MNERTEQFLLMRSQYGKLMNEMGVHHTASEDELVHSTAVPYDLSKNSLLEGYYSTLIAKFSIPCDVTKVDQSFAQNHQSALSLGR